LVDVEENNREDDEIGVDNDGNDDDSIDSLGGYVKCVCVI
jgi:hypothetical protein